MGTISGNGLSQGDLATFLTNVVTLVNELKTDYNLVLAKLDADAGVTDTNYAATRAVAAADLSLSV